MNTNLIELAKEAGFFVTGIEIYSRNRDGRATKELTKFAELISKQDGWIKCSDRLPKNIVQVLAIDKNGTYHLLMIISYTHKNMWLSDAGHYYDIDDIDCWKPLTQPKDIV